MAEARARVDLSRIKNKIKRRNAFQSEKLKRSKDKRERRKKRKREEEGFGDQAPPKQMPRTIENTRVEDETVVDPKDIEVLKDEENDELASYFQGQVVPKVLITSCQNAKLDTVHFMEDLQEVIPNSEIRERKGFELKRVIPQAKEKGFTTVVVVNEDRKKPNGLLVIHLPNGPTAHFQLSSVKAGKSIKNHGCMTSHKPEVLLNNFNTRLGHSVGRLLAALFPYNPQFVGRQCVTFHNQRDFIFFRRHRYIFKNAKKVGLQEIGPRFTLKLRSLQYGTYDPMFGEYEWMYKRNEMDKRRRKFNLS